ncbi:SCO family protein [Maritimibacter fusiformis]|uniref:SCO family protein n=1 Tax=Maritimibacter fusiformis TaxID=2603819 RepID=A0A5D0R7Y3_9RHOB|nr:SCO family protein [Maritimibacter fusiformis]TYB77760.1 SCO family protein [Maritimibacter fusiformis]
MKPITAILAPLGIVVIAGAAWWLLRPTDSDQFAACRSTEIGTGVASIGGPFTLVDENGTTVTDADVFTKPTLLYFGYTFCPDVCPLDSTRNADALDLLQDRGYDAQAVFISIDPERDTPERVAEFTDLMHDDMIGLTGSLEQVKVASQAYKTYFRKEEDGDPEYYLVDHSTFTYLVLPEHGFLEFFRRDETPEGMAEKTACFIDAAK